LLPLDVNVSRPTQKRSLRWSMWILIQIRIRIFV